MMSCTLVNRLRVRLAVPSPLRSGEWELCASPPDTESSEPTLDMDDVLEREWEASESIARGRGQGMFAANGGRNARRT